MTVGMSIISMSKVKMTFNLQTKTQADNNNLLHKPDKVLQLNMSERDTGTAVLPKCRIWSEHYGF